MTSRKRVMVGRWSVTQNVIYRGELTKKEFQIRIQHGRRPWGSIFPEVRKPIFVHFWGSLGAERGAKCPDLEWPGELVGALTQCNRETLTYKLRGFQFASKLIRNRRYTMPSICILGDVCVYP